MDEADAQATDQQDDPATEPASEPVTPASDVDDAAAEEAAAEGSDVDEAAEAAPADDASPADVTADGDTAAPEAADDASAEDASTEDASAEPAPADGAQDADAGSDTEDVAAEDGAEPAADADAEADPASGDDAAADEALDDGAEPLDGALDAGADAAPEAVNAFEPILNLVDAGGPIIVLLAALSVISLALVIVKLVQFRLLRVANRGFVAGVADQLHRGETQQALEAVQARRGVVARVMEAAIRGQLLTDDEDRVREEVTRVATMKMDGMERGLPLLSLIATISPLLGLLGTVLGMIDAFQQLQDAGDRVDPAILSGGIWEALLTTAAGLSVAIPAAAFYTWLQRSADVSAQYMEDAATQVFTAPLYRESATAEAERADAA